MKYMKNNLTVFEPKHPLSDRNKTDTIPLSQTTRLDIECLYWYLTYGLPLGIFSTQKLNRKITFSCKLSLQFLNRCSEFFSEKLIYNTLLCGEKTQRQQIILETKFVVFRMKWIVLPYSESYSEEIQCIKGKFYPFSYIEQHWLTNAYESSLIFPPFLPILRHMRLLSFSIFSLLREIWKVH